MGGQFIVGREDSLEFVIEGRVNEKFVIDVEGIIHGITIDGGVVRFGGRAGKTKRIGKGVM